MDTTDSGGKSTEPQDIEAPKLKPQHDQFARRMAEGNISQTQAYKESYPQSSTEAARRSASDLMTKPDVGKAIVYYMKEKGLDDKLAGVTLHELVTQQKDGKLRHQALRTYLELTQQIGQSSQDTNIATVIFNETTVPNPNKVKDLGTHETE